MDSELSALLDTTKRMALLAETLKQQTSAAIEEQQRAGQILSHTANGVRGDIHQLVQSTTEQVSRSAREGVDAALATATSNASNILATSLSRLKDSLENVQVDMREASTNARRATWISLLTVIGAAVLLVSGGGILLYFQAQAYADARERVRTAQVSADTMEMYARVNLASCAGHPCVRLDQKSARWGERGEYVLLDTTTPAKTR